MNAVLRENDLERAFLVLHEMAQREYGLGTVSEDARVFTHASEDDIEALARVEAIYQEQIFKLVTTGY